MAALPPLASVLDLEERLGRTLTGVDVARAEALLRDASAAVRLFTGQEITYRRSTVKAQVLDRGVMLPQQPVVSVHAVVTVAGVLNGVAQPGGAVVSYSWYSGGLIDTASTLYLINYTPVAGYVQVDYTHGFEV